MISKIHHELRDRGHLTQAQHDRIEEIRSGRLTSVYYDLRALLYAGVLLFSTGMGILVYKNISDAGHLVAIGLLILMTAACFLYAFRKGPHYSTGEVTPQTPYFDYVVLLGSLLFITVQGYLQFRYDLLTENMGLSTLINAIFFFFIAYRFDHAGVLSLGITALASFFSITVSPQKWYSGRLLEGLHVYLTAVILGGALVGVALFLEHRKIKSHFTFTYLNFAFLMSFVGAVSGLLENEDLMWLYLPVIYAGVWFAYWSAKTRKSFLFLLYAFVAGYIGTTYLLAETVLDRASAAIWFYYFLLSSGGFVYFIIKYRNRFSRQG
jgi:hypothetical protein